MKRAGRRIWFHTLVFAAALAAICLAPGTSRAWIAGDDVVAVRLLPGWQRADGLRMVGLRIDLAEGWKTYWRAPGESGIAPRLDWRGSQNLAGARVLWPRPRLYDAAGLRTIGYADSVVLPVALRPRAPGAPVKLELAMDLGVCREVCLPAAISLSGVVPAAGVSEDGEDRAAIEAALAERPLSAAEAGVDGLSCRAVPIADGLRLEARMAVPRLGGSEAAVIETARRDVWVSSADLARKGSRLTAAADLVPPDAVPFALDRSGIRITLIGRDGAVSIEGCPSG